MNEKGWAYCGSGKKAHYFVDNISLCPTYDSPNYINHQLRFIENGNINYCLKCEKLLHPRVEEVLLSEKELKEYKNKKAAWRRYCKEIKISDVETDAAIEIAKAFVAGYKAGLRHGKKDAQEKKYPERDGTGNTLMDMLIRLGITAKDLARK